MSNKPSFYTCPTCGINFEPQKCPRCKKKGVPVKGLPSERDPLKDPSYFDHIMKKAKAEKNQE